MSLLLAIALLLLAAAALPGAHAHDEQASPQQEQEQAGEPVPQTAVDTVLWEREQGLEEPTFYKWFGDRLRENSLSQAIRDRVYDDEVEKLNPTCSVIGFFLRTIPVCPVVRKLMDCA